MAGEDQEFEAHNEAVKAALDVGVFKEDDEGNHLIVVTDPAQAEKMLRDGGYDEEVVERIAKQLEPGNGDDGNEP